MRSHLLALHPACLVTHCHPAPRGESLIASDLFLMGSPPCMSRSGVCIHSFWTDEKAEGQQSILWFLSPAQGRWILCVFFEVACLCLDFIFTRLRKQLKQEVRIPGALVVAVHLDTRHSLPAFEQGTSSKQILHLKICNYNKGHNYGYFISNLCL